jgi:translation initiation factor 1
MSADRPLSHNPFAALAGLKKPADADAPTSPTPLPEPSAAAPVSASKPKGIARAVVRLERTGRGGKEVTVVDQLGLPRAELERWLTAFKSALGCGGVIEDDRLVLQGDQRDRVRRLLTERGVRKIAG